MLPDPAIEIPKLQREIEILKAAVETLTEALRVVTDHDARANVFIERVKELLD